MYVVAGDCAKHRGGFEREDRLGVDLGYGAVERVLRNDVAPRRDAVHIDALRTAENQAALVALREHVVGQRDRKRQRSRTHASSSVAL